jgi:MFS superfamily sulfate permease-like transporter
VFLFPNKISADSKEMISAQKFAMEMPVLCALILFFTPVFCDEFPSRGVLSKVAIVLFIISAVILTKFKSAYVFDIPKSNSSQESSSSDVKSLEGTQEGE